MFYKCESSFREDVIEFVGAFSYLESEINKSHFQRVIKREKVDDVTYGISPIYIYFFFMIRNQQLFEVHCVNPALIQ